MQTKTMCIHILDVCYSDAFLSEPTIHRILEQAVSVRWIMQIQFVPVDVLPYGFWNTYEYLTNYQSKDSEAH